MDIDQEEEIIALKAIFCQNDDHGIHITVHFKDLQNDFESSAKRCDDISLLITLPKHYPSLDVPYFKVTCSLIDDNTLQSLTNFFHHKAAEMTGRSMLMELICYARDRIADELKDSASTSRSLDEGEPAIDTSDNCTCNVIVDHQMTAKHQNNCHKGQHKLSEQRLIDHPIFALLHLDHMRSRSNYIKVIKKWTSELSLNGRLIFCKKLIFILLQGDVKNVKEYIVRNKTHNVDVDSKGRSCKEKMLTVLCEVPALTGERFTEFCVVELDTVSKLEHWFSSVSLQNLFHDYVCGVVRNSH